MQQQLSPIEQVISVKALNETLAKKAQELSVFIDDELAQLGITNDMPIDKVSMDYDQSTNLLRSYLDEFAPIHEITRSLASNVTSFIAKDNIHHGQHKPALGAEHTSANQI